VFSVSVGLKWTKTLSAVAPTKHIEPYSSISVDDMARAPVWTTSLRAAFMAMEPVCLRAWPSIISLFETAQKNSRGRNSGRLKVTVHPISQNVSLFFLENKSEAASQV
jgi:hypothetical protein